MESDESKQEIIDTEHGTFEVTLTKHPLIERVEIWFRPISEEHDRMDVLDLIPDRTAQELTFSQPGTVSTW
jgi:hypothetical protein